MQTYISTILFKIIILLFICIIFINHKRAFCDSIIDKMSKQKENITNFEGTFELQYDRYLSPDEIQNTIRDLDAMKQKAPTPYVEQTIDNMKAKTKEGRNTEYLLLQGICYSAGRFSIKSVVHPGDYENSIQYDSIFIFDGKSGVKYNYETKVAGIYDKVSQTYAGNINYFMQTLINWMSNPVFLDSGVDRSKCEVSESEGALNLVIPPTDYTLNLYSLAYSFNQNSEGIPNKIVFVNRNTNNVVREITSNTIQEISPGVIRPMEVIDKKYNNNGSVDYQIRLKVLEVKRINSKLDQSEFVAVPPAEAKEIVDYTSGRPIEIDKEHWLSSEEDSLIERVDKTSSHSAHTHANPSLPEQREEAKNGSKFTDGLKKSEYSRIQSQSKTNSLISIWVAVSIVLCLSLIGIGFRMRKP